MDNILVKNKLMFCYTYHDHIDTNYIGESVDTIYSHRTNSSIESMRTYVHYDYIALIIWSTYRELHTILMMNYKVHKTLKIY